MVQKNSNISDIYGFVGKIGGTTFECMVVTQYKGPNCHFCWNFVKPGSQSAGQSF